MAIIFNPDTGFIADETGVIRNQIATDWKTAFKTDESAPELNTGPETPAGQLIDGMAALVAEKTAKFYAWPMDLILKRPPVFIRML